MEYRTLQNSLESQRRLHFKILFVRQERRLLIDTLDQLAPQL